eukprot:TRINITY_DN3935_c0_g1_i1.p1 TRINITY_DN3935_c0_g1~~TRINITY_DN3935_c0_g1_i1.p1  ORF type:complete len:764 (-),score=110.51 TRINITY_DN3935_c0_g1_i1:72-2363(-)
MIPSVCSLAALFLITCRSEASNHREVADGFCAGASYGRESEQQPSLVQKGKLKVSSIQPREEGPTSCIPVTVRLTTGSWGREVSWKISSTKATFRAVESQEVYANRPTGKKYLQQECLPVATEYTITMMDSYGDGWNGAEVAIYAGTYDDRDTLPGTAEFTGALSDGSKKEEVFTLPLPRDYSPPSPDALDVVMQAKLEEWKLLGFSVAIFRQGAYSEPITRGYGKTHADPAQASPVTGDTVQMIASMSKTILGAAATKLIDAGDVNLDDDIKDVLPRDWTPVGTSRNPKAPSTPVTWRHIMTHTSSMTRDVQAYDRSYGPKGAIFGSKIGNDQCPLTDLSGFYGDYLMDRGITTRVGQDGSPFNWYEEAQKKGGAWNSADRPGEKYKYSNFATGYLALLVELAAAKSSNFRGSPTFSEFCKQEIFDVLDMKNTAWFREDLPRDVSEATPAEWHNGKHDNIGHYCFIDYASGQLHSSARDLAKFGQAWLNYGAGRGGFISESTGKMAVGCVSRSPDGSTPADDDCKMGALWFRMTNKQRDSGDRVSLDPVRSLDWTDGIAHSGSEKGILTNMIVMPRAGLVAVVLTNGKGYKIQGRSFMHEIMGALLDSAPLTSNERGEMTWPKSNSTSPPPMWLNPNGCCTKVVLKASIDADEVEKVRPGTLGEYVLTDKHTKTSDGKVRGVYEKKGPCVGTRGKTLSMDPMYGDWRVFDSNPMTDPSKPNLGSFYSYSATADVCPETSTKWKVKMGNSPYTDAYGLTLQCA